MSGNASYRQPGLRDPGLQRLAPDAWWCATSPTQTATTASTRSTSTGVATSTTRRTATAATASRSRATPPGATLANNLLVDNGGTADEYDLYVDAGSVAGLHRGLRRRLQPRHRAGRSSTAPSSQTFGALRMPPPAWRLTGSHSTPAFARRRRRRLPAHRPGSAAVDSADAARSRFSGTDAAATRWPTTRSSPTPAPAPDVRRPRSPRVPAHRRQRPTTRRTRRWCSTRRPCRCRRPTTVTADASGSSDADTTGIASYTFDFGDGTTVGPQPAPTATHAYRSPGTFHVTVTVTDDAGSPTPAGADEVVTQRALRTYYVTGSSALCTDTGTGNAGHPVLHDRGRDEEGARRRHGAGRCRHLPRTALRTTGGGEPGPR